MRDAQLCGQPNLGRLARCKRAKFEVMLDVNSLSNDAQAGKLTIKDTGIVRTLLYAMMVTGAFHLLADSVGQFELEVLGRLIVQC
jgi:hypothetical protein